MRKLLLLPIFTLFIVIFSYSQNELEKEILGIKDSSELIVRNSRKLVNTRLHEGKYNDLINIISYAKANIDKNSYIAFYPWEEQVMSILSGDVSYFCISAADDNFNNYAIQPQDDYLGQYAISIINENKETWKDWFNTLLLDDEKKQVIRIFLGVIGLYDSPLENQKLVSRFLKEYPTSAYKKYVSSFKRSFKVGTFEYEFGGGIWKLNGGLTQYISPSSAIFFGMGGFSNRFYWDFFFMGANETDLLSSILVTDENNNQYMVNSGEGLSLINAGMKFGWLVYRNDWVKLYPIATISGSSLDLPTQEGRNSESIILNSTFNLGAGICTDFDIIHWTMKNYYSSAQSHLGIRLSAGYQSYLASKKYIGGSGYYCTASLVWWIGKM